MMFQQSLKKLCKISNKYNKKKGDCNSSNSRRNDYPFPPVFKQFNKRDIFDRMLIYYIILTLFSAMILQVISMKIDTAKDISVILTSILFRLMALIQKID